ncbi:MAG: Bax inhibitor-1/YccA family protein [Roseibacillus sp.]
MFDQANPYAVSAASVDQRAEFIRKTYYHVAGATAALALLLAVYMQIPAMVNLAQMMGANWLIVLGLFMFVSWISEKWAHSATSLSKQYLGLGLFVFAYSILFLPMILVAATVYPGVITKAAVATGALTFGISLVAFTTKKDFSFLGGIIKIGGFIALGLIVMQFLPIPGLAGFDLGLWFSIGMVVLASASILYNTSNMIHHYRTDQYVAASLGLFASVALLFWYLLRIFMSRD